MAKIFRVDLSDGIGDRRVNSPNAVLAIASAKRRGSKSRRPGLPPTVRGLPWSKMLRSFREKSS